MLKCFKIITIICADKELVFYSEKLAVRQFANESTDIWFLMYQYFYEAFS